MPTYITLLRKKAKRGDQGFPRATLAFYGPNDKRATKAVLGIFLREDAEGAIHRYFSEEKDARFNTEIQKDVVARLQEHEVRSLVMVEKIFGCPHEEGKDYPEGESCPHCPFWKDRDRFAALELKTSLTRRQSQRLSLSRLVLSYVSPKEEHGLFDRLLHEPRQRKSWLIFDVGQETNL